VDVDVDVDADAQLAISGRLAADAMKLNRRQTKLQCRHMQNALQLANLSWHVRTIFNRDPCPLGYSKCISICTELRLFSAARFI